MDAFCRKWAAFHGFCAVALGAFAAHGLKDRLAALPPEESQKMLGWMETASRYQLAHAVALLALPAVLPHLSIRPARYAAWAWTLGVCVFSGSLYAMALGAPRWLGAVTPIGGVGLLTGWFALWFSGRKA